MEPLRGAVLGRLRRLLDLHLDGLVDLEEVDLELEEIAERIRRDAAACPCSVCQARQGTAPWWRE